MVYPRDIVRKWDGLRVLSRWQQLLIFTCYSVRSLAPPRTQVAQLLACICMFRTVCYTDNIRRKKRFYTDSSKYYFMTTLINSRIFICDNMYQFCSSDKGTVRQFIFQQASILIKCIGNKTITVFLTTQKSIIGHTDFWDVHVQTADGL